MIVTCPECRTRYRYPHGEPDGAVRCQCSNCESTFLAGSVGRPYLVTEPPASNRSTCEPDDVAIQAPVPSPVESPEPAPAQEPAPFDTPAEPASIPILVGPGLEEPEQPAMSIGMDDPTLAPRLEETALDGGEAGLPATPMTYVVENEEPAAPPVEETPEVEEAAPVRRSKPGFGAFLFVLLISTVCAAGGWQLAIQLGENPVDVAPATGVVGLLVAWLWVRWKYKRS